MPAREQRQSQLHGGFPLIHAHGLDVSIQLAFATASEEVECSVSLPKSSGSWLCQSPILANPEKQAEAGGGHGGFHHAPNGKFLDSHRIASLAESNLRDRNSEILGILLESWPRHWPAMDIFA
jgi:hypothetical protein